MLDRALTQIGREVQAMAEGDRLGFSISQIKEKYGTLSIYANGCNERTARLIVEAEELSEQVCEHCGDFGMMHVFNGGEWFWTLCPRCAQERAAERKMSVELEGSRQN